MSNSVFELTTFYLVRIIRASRTAEMFEGVNSATGVFGRII